MTLTTDCTTQFEKSIAYDRFEECYRAELDGEIKGYYTSYGDAENALNTLVYELLAELPAQVADDAADFAEAVAECPELAVQVERWVCDDDIDTARYGTEIGTNYVCGLAELYVSDDPDQEVDLCIGGIALHGCEIEAAISHLMTLLNDPRVQRARKRRVVGAPSIRMRQAA